MHLAGIQFDIAWENRAANFAKVTALLERNPPPRGSLVALPEMFPSGFSMNVAAIAEDEARSIEKFCRDIARRFGTYLIAGLTVRAGGDRGRNESLIMTPSGEVLARYHKLHPYADERNHYLAGAEIVTFKWNDATVSPFICYDLRFPEAFRAAMQRGAEVMVVIANWPVTRIEHWLTLARARAIENQCYVLAVNRIGVDPNVSYCGRSMIVDFRGDVIADAGGEEAIITAPIDLAALRKYRADLPFLIDARGDLNPPKR